MQELKDKLEKAEQGLYEYEKVKSWYPAPDFGWKTSQSHDVEQLESIEDEQDEE